MGSLEQKAIDAIRQEPPYTYDVRDNQIILNPDTMWEENITESNEECDYCTDRNLCTRDKGAYCDEFSIDSEWRRR